MSSLLAHQVRSIGCHSVPPQSIDCSNKTDIRAEQACGWQCASTYIDKTSVSEHSRSKGGSVMHFSVAENRGQILGLQPNNNHQNKKHD
jgi:hypothetical protein